MERKSRNEIMAEINRLQGELAAIEAAKISENLPLFTEEVLNLCDCVGKGFRSGNYYAPDRFYSEIPGVKNIRFKQVKNNGEWVTGILVKLYDKRGFDLPQTLEVRGTTFYIHFIESENFVSEVLD